MNLSHNSNSLLNIGSSSVAKMQDSKTNCPIIQASKGTLYSSTRGNNDDFHNRLRKLYPGVEDVSQLPLAWCPDLKAIPLGLSDDNLGCYHRGVPRRHDRDKDESAAAVRTEQHIPPACLLYYFEIKFLSKGRDGYMGLGLTSAMGESDKEITKREHPLNKLPGWVPGSYGYHADDGNIFNGDGRGSPFGPTFTSGDVIGCGFNLIEGKCFFTKNGLNLGKAFEDIPTDVLFFPTIGLKSYGEEIRANFGQEEFLYDIEQDIRSLRKNLTMTISDFPISDFGDWENTLHTLVQSWLLDNSYPSTAAAFNKTTKLSCDRDMQCIQSRNRIQQLVLKGTIGDAIKLTNELCPNLLQDNPNLLFKLKCRQFIEMVAGVDNESRQFSIVNNSNNHTEVASNGTSMAGDEQKLAKLIMSGQELCEYSRQLEKLNGKNEANERMLLDAIGLIAFNDPKNSYYKKSIDSEEREAVSQQLNSSILKSELGANCKVSPMDGLMAHVRDLVSLNNSQGHWLVDQLY